jgi:hypothetical protein
MSPIEPSEFRRLLDLRAGYFRFIDRRFSRSCVNAGEVADSIFVSPFQFGALAALRRFERARFRASRALCSSISASGVSKRRKRRIGAVAEDPMTAAMDPISSPDSNFPPVT